MKPIIPLATLACAVAAAPAAAQAAERATSVSLDLGGGPAIGLWRDVSPRVRAGVEVGTSVSRLAGDDGEEDFTNVSVQPSVKIFSTGEGDVRPYTLVGLYASRYGQRQASSTDPGFENEFRRREVGARLGLGLEWTPLRRVAVGGHVGVGAGYLESRSESSIGDDHSADGWAFNTLGSGIVLHLFF